ncbi:MAG TPA: dUTP diphosphatase [Polyangiaceae bacterium]|nr:dUTP diphosphatase [Polyangiaceae bacterium]
MNARLGIKRVGPLQVPLPAYQTPGSAGLDLCAALNASVMLAPGQHRLFPTGICLEIPDGFEGQVRPRSGLALRHGITVLNAPGAVDSDYRGEVGVVLVNHGPTPVEIKPLDRIAQLVIAPIVRVDVEVVAVLSETDRAAGGYGSTGV